MDYYNHILQLNKHRLNVCTTPKIRPTKLEWIEEHLHHQHLFKPKNPSLLFIGDSISNVFTRYGNISGNHFVKRTVNCGIKGDRTENLIHRIEDLLIPQHVKKDVIICGTNNLDRDRPSDIANALICAAILTLSKQNQIKWSMAFSQRIKEIALEGRNYYRPTIY